MKTALQRAKKTQIVARLMVEELAFFGMRNVRDVETSLHGYDQTCFPRTSDWSFTRFYLPHAVAGGYHLVDDAPVLWEAFERLHHKHALGGPSKFPWSHSHGRWKSSLRTATCAMHRVTSLKPPCGTWLFEAGATSRHDRP